MLSFLPETAGGGLLEAGLRTLLLAGIVGAGLRLWRVHNPHTELAAWRCVLVGALVMPLLMSVMIFEVLPGPTVAAAPSLAMGDTVIPADNIGFGLAGALLAADVLFEGAAEGVAQAATFDWHQVLLPLYGAVAAAMLARLGLGVLLALRLRADAVPLRAPWSVGLDVRISARLAAPVTIGTTILFPADHWAWSAEKRAAALAHEAAHAARGDYHVQVLAGLHRTLFWFNPLAWWLHDKLADLAEVASDAEAATVLEERSSYAAVLLDFAARPRLRGIIAVGMARQETVARRVDRILDTPVMPTRLPRTMGIVITGAVAFLTLASAATLAQGPVTQMPLPPAMTPPTPRLLVPEPADMPVRSDLQLEAARDAADTETRAKARAERAAARQVELQRRLAERTAEREVRVQERAEERLRDRGRPESTSFKSATLPQGGAQRETRNVANFTGVALAAVLGNVNITIGDKPSLILEGDAETLRQVRSEVRHGTLVIDHDLSNASRAQEPWRGLGGVTAHVTVPRLRGVSLSGVGRVNVVGLDGGETQMQLSGSGVIHASGNLDKLDLKISGAGKANLAELVTGEADVNISGAGDAVVQPRERLTVDISGSARVHYIGNPQTIRTSISGWGTVHAR